MCVCVYMCGLWVVMRVPTLPDTILIIWWWGIRTLFQFVESGNSVVVTLALLVWMKVDLHFFLQCLSGVEWSLSKSFVT
jgi:hypothetical protein